MLFVVSSPLLGKHPLIGFILGVSDKLLENHSVNLHEIWCIDYTLTRRHVIFFTLGSAQLPV